MFKSDVYTNQVLARKYAEIEIMMEKKRAKLHLAMKQRNASDIAWLRERLNDMQYARQAARDELVRRIVKL